MLYCLKKDIVYKGKRTITEIFYGDKETAKEAFNDSKAIKIFTCELTLLEINTKGLGFTDPTKIDFEKYNPIDHYDFIIE